MVSSDIHHLTHVERALRHNISPMDNPLALNSTPYDSRLIPRYSTGTVPPPRKTQTKVRQGTRRPPPPIQTVSQHNPRPQ
ncbi:hypothetical protein BO82DRAFT_5396 [Aspergillus uvarum CBS 121591]|uniref:Uncharacterized protein n=1 Tax=Aspergillus uvarum CBS 121591 TaxID=1448315 RepID=A0A319DGF5_9EURO|nr:hypothetical protein BO82DRAFT_5396 [Aspergillus uvarum CBS 121591]PYH87208.1 hypothetical protein BO82DRAFT_5396 [Aspergillus uvarum CBS 121591]